MGAAGEERRAAQRPGRAAAAAPRAGTAVPGTAALGTAVPPGRSSERTAGRGSGALPGPVAAPCPARGRAMAAPSLDPELARQLFFEGAAVVVLGVPEGTEFGIDYSTWTVGPRFRGVKMIPPGVHFLHCSAGRAGGGRETGPRTGFFLSLQRREVRVLRWDAASEAVGQAAPAAGEAEAFRGNLPEMDRFLGPYPYETLKKWVSLTSFIGEAAMKKLQPESGQICAFSEVLPVAAGRHTRDRAEQRLPPVDAECRSYAEGLARLPRMKPRAGTEIRFTELPEQMYPAGATPEEITRHSMDLSYALEKVIAQRYASQPLDLLGEYRVSPGRALGCPGRVEPFLGGTRALGSNLCLCRGPCSPMS